MKINVDQYYFIGIGGAGMSALALYCHKAGKQVAGYDRTESNITKELENQGVSIHYKDDISNIPKAI